MKDVEYPTLEVAQADQVCLPEALCRKLGWSAGTELMLSANGRRLTIQASGETAPIHRYDMQDLDLLAGAWGWNQDEMAQALRVAPEQLRAWRNHEAPLPEDVRLRIDKLHQVQHELWMVLPPGQYARWWRAPNSGFDGRTALDIVLSDETGFDRVIGSCRSANW